MDVKHKTGSVIDEGKIPVPESEALLKTYRAKLVALIEQFQQAAGRFSTMTVCDDSMEPEMPRGTRLLVDAGDDCFPTDGTVIVKVNGRLEIRRSHLDGRGNVHLIADNEKYERVIASVESPGRAVDVAGKPIQCIGAATVIKTKADQ